MSDKVLLSERIKRIIIENVQKTVDSIPNPDLAKSILYMLQRDGPLDAKQLALGLDIKSEEIEEIIENHFIPGGLVLDKTSNFHLEEEGRIYLQSDIYGSRKLIVTEGLDPKVILACMNSVSDLVRFNYEKRFEFTMEKLEEIRSQSHEALKTIRKREEEFFYNKLNVPREYTFDIPTFVSENNPDRIDGYERRSFNFCGSFNSPEEAFQIGFDSAIGYPTLEISLQTRYEMRNYLPGCIEVNIPKRKLMLENVRYNTTEDSFAYQQKAKEILPTLQDRLEKVLL